MQGPSNFSCNCGILEELNALQLFLPTIFKARVQQSSALATTTASHSVSCRNTFSTQPCTRHPWRSSYVGTRPICSKNSTRRAAAWATRRSRTSSARAVLPFPVCSSFRARLAPEWKRCFNTLRRRCTRRTFIVTNNRPPSKCEKRLNRLKLRNRVASHHCGCYI